MAHISPEVGWQLTKAGSATDGRLAGQRTFVVRRIFGAELKPCQKLEQ